MKIINEIPEELLDNIHTKALKSLTRDRATYTVGMHTARMKINGAMRKTIIPPVNIYISRVTKQGVISSDIDYRIVYNGQTFPLGHVYGGSGYLCLGNIPVPPYVSETDLMLPLETLFLYNDRVMHGNPKLNISNDQHKAMMSWALRNNIALNTTPNRYLHEDVLWDLGAQLLEKYDIETAYSEADVMFKIAFNVSQELERWN